MHQLVDVAVDVAVEGPGAAGSEGAAHQRGQDQSDGREAALGVNHGGQRADEQQLDDAGFGEGEIRLGLAGQPGSPSGGEALSGVSVVLTVAVTRSVWQFCLAVQLISSRWSGQPAKSRRGVPATPWPPETPEGTVTRRRPPNIIPCAFVTEAPSIGPDDRSKPIRAD